MTPLETYSTRGAAEALVQVVRGVPGLVLKPVRGLLVGGALPLRAMAAAADPSIRQRAARKYRLPAQQAVGQGLNDADKEDDEDDDFVLVDK